MKIAILLVGNFRTWDLCKESFIKTFGEMDTFICSYDLRYGYHPNGWGVTDLHDEIITEEVWKAYTKDINVKMIRIEEISHVNDDIKNQLPYLKLKVPNVPQSYGQYRKFKIATDMIQEFEKKHDFKYDIIVRSRLDLFYNDTPIDYNIGENEVVYHHGTSPPNEFLGDQFFFSKRNNIINISKFISDEFYNPIYEDSHLHPPHGVLRNALRHNNLTKTNRNMVKHLKRKNEVDLIL
jgi:hypothetical protein